MGRSLHTDIICTRTEITACLISVCDTFRQTATEMYATFHERQSLFFVSSNKCINPNKMFVVFGKRYIYLISSKDVREVTLNLTMKHIVRVDDVFHFLNQLCSCFFFLWENSCFTENEVPK